MKCPICELECTPMDLNPGVPMAVMLDDDHTVEWYDQVVEFRCEGGHAVYLNPTDISNQIEAEKEL
jgi:hypothetical protein